MTPRIALPILRPNQPSEAYLPESPREVVVGGRPAIAWVNIQTGPTATAGEVHLWFWQSRERRVLPQSGRPGFLLPTNRPNVVLVGMDRMLGTLDLARNRFVPLVRLASADARTIINDAEIVPGGGGVVFGTKDLAFASPIASLYYWTVADNRVTELCDRQTCSNGKFFHRERTGRLSLFDIDTPKKSIVRYQFDERNRHVGEPKTVVSFAQRDDFPDGMVAVGTRSALVAFYQPNRGGDGEAGQYELKTGKCLGLWRIPGSPRVTCPLIIRRANATKVLFTTADEGMSEVIRAASPNAGTLFEADVNDEPVVIGSGNLKGVIRMQTEVVRLDNAR